MSGATAIFLIIYANCSPKVTISNTKKAAHIWTAIIIIQYTITLSTPYKANRLAIEIALSFCAFRQEW